MSKARIMVVEDEGVTALQIRESLESMGYDVPLIALTGEEAVDKVLETEPDLVLMDIKLTGRLSGIDAAHKIRGRLDVPVIYLTAFSDEETLALAQVTDPEGYVLKPFEDKSLHAIIEMSLSRHQHARQVRESGMWMSALADSMTEAVLICDAKGYVKFINPAAEALIGKRLREVQEMRTCDVVSLLDTETRTPLPFPVTEPLLEGRSTMRGNCSLRAGEGREYPVEFTASPLRSPEGTLFGILYVLRRTGEREIVHGRVLRELDALSRLQKRSLPSGDAAIPGASLQWFLLPAQFGGGDALGCMPLDDGHVGFYSLTVPGGGLLSAMFSLLLGMFLTPSFERGGILVEKLCAEPGHRVLTPAEVAQLLGKRFFLKNEATPPFTLVYGVLENATGTVSLVRAGHPGPISQSADGMVHLLKPDGQAIGPANGPAVGPANGPASGAELKMETLHLGRNDRLFLCSDGLVSCQNRAGQPFSPERLMQGISASRRKSLRDAVADIREEVAQWRGGEPFAADASILALERE